MNLILVRHGIALDVGGIIRTDRDRPLSPEGIEETELVARGLKKAGVKIDQLVSSPLIRARQTSDIFAEAYKLESAKICDALAPGIDASAIFTFLRQFQKTAESIAIFGHEPDMGDLVQILLGAEFSVPFKKAGVCRIDVFDMPPTTPGVLKWFVPPKMTRLLGK